MRREFLVPLFLAALVTSAAAAEIRVPQDQPTIQAAIDVAIADDVVIVSRGVYDENVSIVSRSDLTIEGRGAVVIRSTGTGLFIHASHNISVTGIGVKGGTIGIDVFESNDVTIQKFTVAGVDQEGVRADDSTDIRLLDGRVHDTGDDGVLFGFSVGVTSCQINGVKVSECGADGIEAFGTNVLVSNCKVSGVEGDGFESQEGLSPVRFEQCKATRAEGDGFNMGATGTVAVGCTAKKCGDDGFDVEGSGSDLEDCQAKGSRDRGFGIDDVDGVDVLSCKAVGCGGQGFELQNATNSRIESSTAIRSGEEGFLLSGESSGNTLVGNKASKSGSVDLGDSSEGPNTFTDNQFRTMSSN